MSRQEKFFWMRDLLDRLGRHYDDWEIADGTEEVYLAESMERDLTQLRRLCQSLRDETPVGAGCSAASAL